MIIERPFAIFWGCIFLIVFMTISFIKKRPMGRKILLALCTLYISGIITITIFPIVIDPETMMFNDSTINLRPFSTIRELLFNNSDLETVLLQLMGNIVMCIPFGVAFPLIIKHKYKFLYFIDALLFPVAIETAQLIISVINNSFYRTIDIDDIILNYIGVLIGYAIYILLPQFTKDFFSDSKKPE